MDEHFLQDLEEPEAVIEGLFYPHTHDCQAGKSFSKGRRTVRKSNSYRPTLRMKVPDGS
jgi:hypothetical protein